MKGCPFISLFVFCLSAWGQTLSVGSASGPIGAYVEVPITLGLGRAAIAPAGIQWTITTPKRFPAEYRIGSAALSAGKEMSCFSVDNGFSISTTCLLVGPNSAAINGGVVAYARVAVSSLGSVPLSVSGTVSVSPSGRPLPLSGVSGQVTRNLIGQLNPGEMKISPFFILSE